MNNRIRGIYKYYFKGMTGWSWNQPVCVDIADITSYDYSHRLFYIFNFEYKYTLEIKIKSSYCVTRRFKTENEVWNEITYIMNKQDDLDDITNKTIKNYKE